MPQGRIAGARGTGLLAASVALSLALASSAFALLGVTLVRGAATLPDEPGAFRIDGPSFAALVADVDGDGLSELVRITSTGIDGSRMAVEIWRQAKDGTWSITGPPAPLRRGHSPEEVISGAVDPDNLAPALADDSARLLLWREGGRVHVLAVVNAGSSAGDRSPCCLTVWQVTERRGGGPPALTLLIDTQRGGDTVYAVDMDGDRNDELAVREPGPAGLGSAAAFNVLRWSAGRFTVITRPLNAGDVAQAYPLDNSDGLPGDEIGLVGSFGPAATGYGLTRVSLRAGAIHAETSELPSDGVVLPVTPADGSRAAEIVFGDLPRSVMAFSWPADRDMAQVARSTRRGQPVGVIGSGANARIMVLRVSPPALDLMATDLSEGSIEGVRPSGAAKPFFATAYAPYVGPWLNPSSGGVPEQVFAGTLMSAPAGQRPDFTPMAVLPGMEPLGEVGSAGAWTAVSLRTKPSPGAPETAPRGGTLMIDDAFSITLVRTIDVLTPETDGGAIRPAVEDAVVDGRSTSDERQGLLIGTPVFEAKVTAPEGSLALAVTGSSYQVHVLSPNPGPTGGSGIPGPPFRVPIVSSSSSGGNQAYDAALQVITPAGHGYTAQWHVRLLRTPPKISGEASFLSSGFFATVSGVTDPTATVTADGQSVRAGVDGRYQLNVPAGFVPRDAQVQARDPIGNHATVTVSVVAPVDYRRLPWIPIFVVLTMSVGAVLFLRAPRLVARPLGGRADEGTFEEIDPDSSKS